MSHPKTEGVTRRDMMKTSGGIAVASALAGVAIPAVHAGENNTIQIALVGCGGRGTGAAADAMLSKNGPTKLVAMADVFEDKLDSSYRNLSGEFAKQMDVPEDRRFIGFDAYQKAMDCLRPGDVAIFATPPAFRWVHLTYAIQKGIHVFMEKPTTVDGPSTRKMFKLAEEADKKNIKIGVGLMCRHCEAREQLLQQINDGKVGDILTLRAYRMHPAVGSAFTLPRPSDSPMTELLYQIRRFHAFLWASGGCFSDFYIHNIDECCWMKGAWPVKAHALGGRHYRGDFVDQNFDNYSVEYTFEDGTKLYLEGRCMDSCHQEFASYGHGTKGAFTISASGHSPARCRIYKGQNFTNQDIVWRVPSREPNPYRLEWDHLLGAIRADKPYNEAKRGAEASLVTSMGRMAAHTGRVVTYDQILNSDHEFAPEVDKLTMSSSAPLLADASGKYPLPQPGIKTRREF